MTFGHAILLAGLILPVLAAAAAWYAVRRARLTAEEIGGPPALRTAHGPWLRVVTSALAVGAVLLAVLAGARPQWGTGDASLPQRGIDVVIALDVSRSMEAQDVLPNRAEAASERLGELLSHMTGSRVGLVVFAGSAFSRAPLTTDLQAVASLIRRSQREAPLVEPGTNFRAALAESFRVLDVADPARSRAVLFVSDGEDLESNFEEAVDFAARRDIRIYTVLVGSTDPVALPPETGGTDITVADPATLQAMASATGGTYRTVESIPGFAVEFRRLQLTTFEDAPSHQPVERFAWFAGGAALLLLLAALLGEGGRSGLPRLHRGAISTGLLVAITAVLAGCGSPAWREVERGNDAYRARDFTAALQAYERAEEVLPDHAPIHYNIANTFHELGLFGDAERAGEEARSLALDAEDGATAVRALFTIGNSAFLREDFEAARDAYQAALRIDPADRDTKANLELVLRLLEPPPPPPPPDEPQQGDDVNGDDANGEETGEGEAPGEGEGEPGEPEGEPSEQPTDQPGTPTGQQDSGPPGGRPTDEFETLSEVQDALREALGQLGPVITQEEAQRLLDLARRANELQPLPRPPTGGQTPPR